MRVSRLIVKSLASAVLVIGLVACGGGGGGGGTMPTQPQQRVAVLWVDVPAGAEFSGFDLTLSYNPAVVTIPADLNAAAQAYGMGAVASCQPAHVGATVRLACVDESIIRGPGRIARFEMHYFTGPIFDAFALSCAFADADGNTVPVSCTAELVY